MNPKYITSWRALASVESDTAELALQFSDGTSAVFKALPPQRLAALIAVLESSQSAALVPDSTGRPAITNAANAPGK